MTSAAGTVLVGREREQAVIDQLLLDVRSGHSRALVLRGEPGIGKTALLDEMVARAAGMAVVRLWGVQSEGELAYGALHALWSELSEEGVSQLPEPQQTALCITFGLEAGPAPNPSLVGLAMLNGLADLAEQQSLLVVVDDAHWLDHASAQTLAFVARRLQAEGVGLVFAVREAIDELEGLLELPIAGLAPEDARRLLGSTLQVQVDKVTVERFLAETDGNPLALLELSHGLAVADLEGTFDRSDARGLWVRLEESFQRRVEALSPEAQMLLLIAAAEPSGDPLLLCVRRIWSASPAMPLARSRKPGCCMLARALCSVILWSARRSTGLRHPMSVDLSTALWRKRRTRRSIPTVERGTGRGRHQGPTRKSQLSWSARPGEP